MVALLYREWLCLAAASRIEQIYTIQACIALNNIKLEEVDNGRGSGSLRISGQPILTSNTGLQCHTAPYSWKLVFISDHQLYELILTACTPKEEMEWCSRLQCHEETANQDQMQPSAFSFLALNIKSLGTVFRKPGMRFTSYARCGELTPSGTIARRISIHRATTVGPKSPLCQVILKNTSVIKEVTPPSTSSSQINRSQSLLTTTARIPVLAPPRGERARLEALLSDVWTRDILPFPGITARSRSEHLVRASASSMMRKLSVVSIASSFSKRSASLASMQQKCGACMDEDVGTSAVVETVVESEVLCEEPGRSLLSVIPDEAERKSPSVGKAGEWGRCFTPISGERDSGSLKLSRASTREEKENLRDGKKGKKLGGRFTARVGVLHREVVVQGFKNLFR